MPIKKVIINPNEILRYSARITANVENILLIA